MIDLPPDWHDAARRIADAPWRRIAVLGPNGAGKSTFCHWLADALPETNLLDADIGQPSLSPPGTVALAGGPVYFVGGTSPMQHLMPLLVGVARLATRAGPGRLLVNTGGLVRGPGVVLKTFKIDAIQADALVALDPAAELAPLLAAHRHLPVLTLRPSAEARRRSQAERRAAREAAFARALAGGRVKRLEGLVVQRLPREPVPQGLLCGLADAAGDCLGIGLIEAVDGDRATIFTAVHNQKIYLLQCGTMRVGRDGRELAAHHNERAAVSRGPRAIP